MNLLEAACEYVNRSAVGLVVDDRVVGIGIDMPVDRFSGNSDIDVLIFSRGKYTNDFSLPPFHNYPIDVQWIDVDDFFKRVNGRLLDLGSLRLAGRLQRCRIIWDHQGELSRLQQMAKGVILAPSEAGMLLYKCDVGLQTAKLDSTLVGTVLKARGAVYALATLTVALTPRRYEKPKWMLDSLRRAQGTRLVGIILDLLGGETRVSSLAPEYLSRTSELMLQMARWTGWPLLTRAATENEDYVHLYQMYRDAHGLLERGMICDAVVTADYALRLCDVLGEQARSGTSQDDLLATWRQSRDALIRWQCPDIGAQIPNLIEAVAGEGYSVQERYKAEARRLKEMTT